MIQRKIEYKHIAYLSEILNKGFYPNYPETRKHYTVPLELFIEELNVIKDTTENATIIFQICQYDGNVEINLEDAEICTDYNIEAEEDYQKRVKEDIESRTIHLQEFIEKQELETYYRVKARLEATDDSNI